MKITLKIIISLLITVSFMFADAKTDVKQLVEEGVQLCKTKGIEVCLKTFNDTKGPFVKGSLYVFAIDYNGLTLAHGGNNKIVGKNLYKIKDPNGTMLFQEFIKIAKTKGEGWLDYKWSHPSTKIPTAKSSFIKAVDDNILIGSGYYK